MEVKIQIKYTNIWVFINNEGLKLLLHELTLHNNFIY